MFKDNLSLHKGIYPVEIIKRGIRVFRALADISCVNQGKCLRVKFKGEDKQSLETLKQEFANYLIYLIQLQKTKL